MIKVNYSWIFFDKYLSIQNVFVRSEKCCFLIENENILFLLLFLDCNSFYKLMSDLIWQLLIFYNSYKVVKFWTISEKVKIYDGHFKALNNKFLHFWWWYQLFCFSITDKDNGPAVVDVFYSDCANTVCSSCLQTPLRRSEILLRRKEFCFLPLLFNIKCFWYSHV